MKTGFGVAVAVVVGVFAGAGCGFGTEVEVTECLAGGDARDLSITTGPGLLRLSAVVRESAVGQQESDPFLRMTSGDLQAYARWSSASAGGAPLAVLLDLPSTQTVEAQFGVHGGAGVSGVWCFEPVAITAQQGN